MAEDIMCVRIALAAFGAFLRPRAARI